MQNWSKLLGVVAMTATLAVAPAYGQTTYSVTATRTTPTIKFDHSTGVLDITGPSQTGQSREFYKPLIESLDTYIRSPRPTTVVNVRLGAVDASTKRDLTDILKKIEQVQRFSATTVNWYYKSGDENMLELGEDMEAIISVPIKLIMNPR